MGKSKLKCFLALAILAVSFMLPQPAAFARDEALLDKDFIVPIAGMTKIDISPGEYVKAVYTWGIGIAALLAVLMLVFGGAQYVLAAGSFAEDSAAKERIKSAILGLLVLVGATVILSVVNPNLTDLTLNPPDILTEGDLKNLQAEFSSLSKSFNTKDAYGDYQVQLDDETVASSIGAKLAASEKAAKADPLLQTDQYNQNIAEINKYFDTYYSDPAYAQKIKTAMTALRTKSGFPPPTDREVLDEVARRKATAYSKVTDALSNQDVPAIKAQKLKSETDWNARAGIKDEKLPQTPPSGNSNGNHSDGQMQASF